MRFIVIIVCFIVGFSATGQAREPIYKITPQDISIQYEQLAELLKDKQGYKKTIEFMHGYIHTNAVFKVSADNPTIQGNLAEKTFKLSKADYINSYIQGSAMVEGYDISIEVLSYDISPDGQHATSKEILIERGAIPMAQMAQNKQSTAQAFTNKTICETLHGLENGRLTSYGAKCHTSVGILNSI